MKCYILLFGEAFREGNQGTRIRDLDTSYDNQINAAKSQMSFIQNLNNNNIDVKVFISSYDTKFKTNLLNIYNNNLINYDFYSKLIGQGKLIHNAIDKIQNISQYDFLLIMRIDLFLKDKFTEIFNPKWDKIMWPSICFKPYHKCGLHPRVNDMIIFIPKKYYKYLKQLNYNDTGHEQWSYFITKTDLTYNDLDTMLNTYHDSDSAKDFNPIYYIVNRSESTEHHNKDEIFDKTTF